MFKRPKAQRKTDTRNRHMSYDTQTLKYDFVQGDKMVKISNTCVISHRTEEREWDGNNTWRHNG